MISILTAWRAYIIGGGLILAAAALSYTHMKAYGAGKQSVLAKLQEDRITILKDGHKVDNDVLTADDSQLLCMLIDGCGVSK